MNRYSLHLKHAFSIVELSVVLVVIGLILSITIVIGQIRDSSTVASILSEQYQYQSALDSFYKTYNALPGDMSNAMTIFDCTSGVACTNGNGNGIEELQLTSLNNTAYEQYQAWTHLYLGKFITSNYTGISSSLTTSTPSKPTKVGSNVPSSKYNPTQNIGYYIYNPAYPSLTNICGGQAPLVIQNNNVKSHVLVLHDFSTQNPNCGSGTTDPLSSKIAYGIDLKIDDGIPTTGSVLALTYNVSPVCYSTVTNRYLMTATPASCTIISLVPSLPVSN